MEENLRGADSAPPPGLDRVKGKFRGTYSLRWSVVIFSRIFA